MREREGESTTGRSLKNGATCVGPVGFVFLVDMLVDSVKCVELSSSFQTARLTIMHYRAVPQSFKGGEPESPADSQVILNLLSFTCQAYINKSHYRLYLCSQDTNILHYLLFTLQDSSTFGLDLNFGGLLHTSVIATCVIFCAFK